MLRTFLSHVSHVHLSVWLLQMCVLEFRLVVIAVKGRRIMHTPKKRVREKKNEQQTLYSLYQFPLTQPMDENILSICVRVVYVVVLLLLLLSSSDLVDGSNGTKWINRMVWHCVILFTILLN